MSDSFKVRCVRAIRSSLFALALASPAALAAVSGSYQGVVSGDSDLNLVGQTMRVDWTYNEGVTPSDTFGAGVAQFDNFLLSMTIRIGSNVWSWDSVGGFSSVFLTNDSVQSFSIGVEDSVVSFVGTFNGPSLVGEPVAADAYSFFLSFLDNQPTGAPDGLTTHLALPVVAPNPDEFRVIVPGDPSDPNQNTMQFSFFTGEGEGGTYYFIEASNVTLATPVPEPRAALMLLAGVGVIGIGMRARRSRLR